MWGFQFKSYCHQTENLPSKLNFMKILGEFYTGRYPHYKQWSNKFSNSLRPAFSSTIVTHRWCWWLFQLPRSFHNSVLNFYPLILQFKFTLSHRIGTMTCKENTASLGGRGNILQSFSNEQLWKIIPTDGERSYTTWAVPLSHFSPGDPTTLPHLEIHL